MQMQRALMNPYINGIFPRNVSYEARSTFSRLSKLIKAVPITAFGRDTSVHNSQGIPALRPFPPSGIANYTIILARLPQNVVTKPFHRQSDLSYDGFRLYIFYVVT